VTTPPVPARLSASVILVRDGADGLETFMVRRHARSRVAPSAFVFPGGTVRPDDVLDIDADALAEILRSRSDTSLGAADAAAVYVCAVRELFEEAAVLLASTRGAPIAVSDQQERLASARLAIQSGQQSLSWLMREFGWQPAFECLVPFSHWVTPVVAPARFDTWFFVAEMPGGQEALHCTIETSAGEWLRPARVLDDDYPIVYATEQHLRRIAACTTVADLVAFASSKPIRRVQPSVEQTDSGPRVMLEATLVDAW
jgi:8-oxo-dGTP pyrophosphatase MutT (NUDIX family)